MQKRTIAVIQQTPDVGGAETYMITLMDSFLKKGYRVVLATNNTKFRSLVTPLGIQIDTIPVVLDIIGNWKGLIKSIIFLPYALWYYTRLLKRFNKDRIDLLFMSGFSEKLLVTYLSRFFHIPVVWLEHGPLKTIFPRNFGLPGVLYRHAAQIPTVVIAPSEHTRKSLVKDAHIPAHKAVKIPDGVVIKGKVHKAERKKQWEGKFIIGNVSRLTREKGQQHLIQAMPFILKRVPDAHLLLIGTGWDENYFRSIIEKLNLESSVELLGYVNDVDALYAQMDIFVFPTVWELEGFGLVVAEAMLHSLPVVGSNIGPVSEVVDEGETGILVPPGNEKALAEAVITFAQDSSLRKKMGEKGYKKVHSVYNSELVAETFIKHFSRAFN